MPGTGWSAPAAAALEPRSTSTGLLPRSRMTPECRTGGARWPDLHRLCNAPGYRDRVLGYVAVPCACDCHDQAEGRVS